jgi:segregation and condensation protein B
MKLLEQKIESLLFFKNEPLSFQWISKMLDTPNEFIKETIANMHPYYYNRGFSLVVTEDSAALMTSESAQELIASITQQKEDKELSKQAIETLSIVVYKGKATKSQIDYIRGVNSIFILRNLLIRGLITKEQNTFDKKAPFYIPTHDLLSFLGINTIKDLPQFGEVRAKINELDEQFDNEQHNDLNLEINNDKDESSSLHDNNDND